MNRKGTWLAGGRYTPWDLTRMLWLDSSEAEWKRAWGERMALTGDSDLDAECPLTGEVWQYMNTAPFEGKWVHCFRHRNHPVTQQRWYVNVPADIDWVHDQIRRGRMKSFRDGVLTVGDQHAP